MARLDLTVQKVTRAGKDIGSGQAVLTADNAEVTNDGKTILKLENTTGAAKTVTFITAATQLADPALTVEDQAYVVPANDTRWIGPFPPTTYNQSNDKLNIDVSADGVTMTPVVSA